MATGDLCHKYGANDLAHKHGGHPLIYKGTWEPAKDIYLFMTFEPLEWVCHTYNATHEGRVDFFTKWDRRKFSVKQTLMLQIPVAYVAAAVDNVLQFTMAAQDQCAAHEDPHVTCTVTATQGTVILLAQTIACPLGRDGAAVVASINLLNGIIQSITTEAAQ